MPDVPSMVCSRCCTVCCVVCCTVWYSVCYAVLCAVCTAARCAVLHTVFCVGFCAALYRTLQHAVGFTAYGTGMFCLLCTVLYVTCCVPRWTVRCAMLYVPMRTLFFFCSVEAFWRLNSISFLKPRTSFLYSLLFA